MIRSVKTRKYEIIIGLCILSFGTVFWIIPSLWQRNIFDTEVFRYLLDFSVRFDPNDHDNRVLLKYPYKVQFIHQSWKIPILPRRMKKWSSSWRKCYPHARHMLWSDLDNHDFIKKNYHWFLKTYENLYIDILRTFAARYIYMFHFGGIYSDIDSECLRPFDHLLLNSTLVIGTLEGVDNDDRNVPMLQHSFIYSVARHPIWIELLHLIMENKEELPPEELAGPMALVSAINSYRKRFPESNEITVYPPHYFNPFSWMTNKNKACKDFNRMSDKELAMCRKSFLNTSYVVQYHAHTWGGGKIL